MHAYMQMAGDGDTGNGDPPPKDEPTGEPGDTAKAPVKEPAK